MTRNTSPLPRDTSSEGHHRVNRCLARSDCGHEPGRFLGATETAHRE